jgi:hypothetical protein
MTYDLFDFTSPGMTVGPRAWRVALVLALLAVLAFDLFIWRPA